MFSSWLKLSDIVAMLKKKKIALTTYRYPSIRTVGYWYTSAAPCYWFLHKSVLGSLCIKTKSNGFTSNTT